MVDALVHGRSPTTRRLQQVLWNLVHNAIKFTPRKAARRGPRRARDGAVQIAVEDNGRGISPEFLPHVFERFRQQDVVDHARVTGSASACRCQAARGASRRDDHCAQRRHRPRVHVHRSPSSQTVASRRRSIACENKLSPRLGFSHTLFGASAHSSGASCHALPIAHLAALLVVRRHCGALFVAAAHPIEQRLPRFAG